MYTCNTFAPSALEGDGWSAPRPRRFTLAQEAGWVSRPVWTGTKYPAPMGIRSPDRPARSELQYRLRYPGLKKHRRI